MSVPQILDDVRRSRVTDFEALIASECAEGQSFDESVIGQAQRLVIWQLPASPGNPEGSRALTLYDGSGKTLRTVYQAAEAASGAEEPWPVASPVAMRPRRRRGGIIAVCTLSVLLLLVGAAGFVLARVGTNEDNKTFAAERQALAGSDPLVAASVLRQRTADLQGALEGFVTASQKTVENHNKVMGFMDEFQGTEDPLLFILQATALPKAQERARTEVESLLPGYQASIAAQTKAQEALSRAQSSLEGVLK